MQTNDDQNHFGVVGMAKWTLGKRKRLLDSLLIMKVGVESKGRQMNVKNDYFTSQICNDSQNKNKIEFFKNSRSVEREETNIAISYCETKEKTSDSENESTKAGKLIREWENSS